MEMEGEVIREEEGKGAEEAPTTMPEEMMKSSLHRLTLPTEKPRTVVNITKNILAAR